MRPPHHHNDNDGARSHLKALLPQKGVELDQGRAGQGDRRVAPQVFVPPHVADAAKVPHEEDGAAGVDDGLGDGVDVAHGAHGGRVGGGVGDHADDVVESAGLDDLGGPPPVALAPVVQLPVGELLWFVVRGRGGRRRRRRVWCGVVWCSGLSFCFGVGGRLPDLCTSKRRTHMGHLVPVNQGLGPLRRRLHAHGAVGEQGGAIPWGKGFTRAAAAVVPDLDVCRRRNKAVDTCTETVFETPPKSDADDRGWGPAGFPSALSSMQGLTD